MGISGGMMTSLISAAWMIPQEKQRPCHVSSTNMTPPKLYYSDFQSVFHKYIDLLVLPFVSYQVSLVSPSLISNYFPPFPFWFVTKGSKDTHCSGPMQPYISGSRVPELQTIIEKTKFLSHNMFPFPIFTADVSWFQAPERLIPPLAVPRSPPQVFDQFSNINIIKVSQY